MLSRGKLKADVSRDGTITISSVEGGGVRFSPAEADALMNLARTMRSMESFPVLPPQVKTSPFCFLTKGRTLRLARVDDLESAMPPPKLAFSDLHDLSWTVDQALQMAKSNVLQDRTKFVRQSDNTPEPWL